MALSPASSVDSYQNEQCGFSSLPENKDSGTQSPRQWHRRRRKRRNTKKIIRLSCLVISFLVLILLALHFPRPNFEWAKTNRIKLPIANVDIPVPNATEWPLIHIVNTRFMQEQGPLNTLGMARLHLFLTFCFPTMISQTSQDFLWIIKTDPAFTTSKPFLKLLNVIRNYSNIMLWQVIGTF